MKIQLDHGAVLWALDSAIEDYARTHYGLVPTDVSTVMDCIWDRFATDSIDVAKRRADVLSRTLVQPGIRDVRGQEFAWVLAVLIHKQGPLTQDLIYIQSGPAPNTIAFGYGYAAAPETVEKYFGREFVEAVYRQDAQPSAIPVDGLLRRQQYEFSVDAFYSAGPTAPLEWVLSRRNSPEPSTPPAGKVNEQRTIVEFDRALDFTRGGWKDDRGRTAWVDSQAQRLVISAVSSNGGVGQNAIRLALTQYKDDCPTLPVQIQAGNKAKVLNLEFRDSAGRRAVWIYDLPAEEPFYRVLIPRDGATLATPNVAPADGQPLDLSHIDYWELHGDQSGTDSINIEVRRIMLLPRDRDEYGRPVTK